MSSPFEMPAALDQVLARQQRLALLGGLSLLLLSFVGGIFNPDEFFRSYLFAYLFWLGISLGAMALVMTQYLTGGAWGTMSRRPLEAAMRNLPLLALLFIPVLLGIHHLYSWSHPDVVAADREMRHRAHYMNVPFFLVRAVIYFGVWIGLCTLLGRWSRQEDEHGSMLQRAQRLSAPGLILYVFTVTFSSVDWAESLLSKWYSTMWGFLFIAGQGLAALSFVICVLVLLRRHEPMASALRPQHLLDLGKLLLTFVMLWAYFSFSQLLVVWAGNLSGEIPWYLPRWHGGWSYVGVALICLEFVVPFLLLLSRSFKRNGPGMLGLTLLLLIMRLVDLYWVVEPDFGSTGPRFHWLSYSLPLGLGGVWTWSFLRNLRQQPLIPPRAINIEKTLQHGKA